MLQVSRVLLRGADAAARARSRIRRERHRCVRRLVQESGRQLQPAASGISTGTRSRNSIFRSARTIESRPGGPDQGQPTHFLTGRQWGMFAVKVPADFGTNKLTWTLVANGQTLDHPGESESGLRDLPMAKRLWETRRPYCGLRKTDRLDPRARRDERGANRKSRELLSP